MASTALDAKINKIRQQNEEIKRRYEEVEEDKKNAAKLNALVQMVPLTDWPERKEPPEFSNPPRTKQKSAKEKHEYVPQTHGGEGKKVHTFAQGDGPPPDPKYNFLADSEREEINVEHPRENVGHRSHNKPSRSSFRKKGTGRENLQKDNKIHKGNHRDDYQPGYDAWRAERNRIDEDRISRQRTAEGNWRREWDNDKMHTVDDVMKSGARATLGDFAKKEYKDFDRKYHANGSEYANHNRGGSQRPHRGQPKSFHGSHENRSHIMYDQHKHNPQMCTKGPLSPITPDERTVIATDKSIKVTLNQNNPAKGTLMSVKVNSPSIAGTGRVGPRQRTRVTYSHSDAEMVTPKIESFPRQKSFEDKSKAAFFNNQKSSNIKRTHSQKKKDSNSKSPYFQRKEIKGEDNNMNSQKYYENEVRSSYPQREGRDPQKPYSASKSPKVMRKTMRPSKYDSPGMQAEKKEADQTIVVPSEDANTKEHNADVQQIEQDLSSCIDVDLKELEAAEVASNDISSEIPLSEVDGSDVHILNTDSVVEAELTTEQQEETEEIMHEKMEEGAEEAALPTESTEGTEDIAKDDANAETDTNIENECLKDDVNNLNENTESQDVEVQLNDSNNDTEDINKLDVSDTVDQQSEMSKEISETFPSDNCDNVKEESSSERQGTDLVNDDPVDLPNSETCSVIEATDQSTYSNEIAPENEAPVKCSTSDEKGESKDVSIAADCCNDKSEDTVSNSDAQSGDATNHNEIKANESLDAKKEPQNEVVVEKEDDKETQKVDGDSKE